MNIKAIVRKLYIAYILNHRVRVLRKNRGVRIDKGIKVDIYTNIDEYVTIGKECNIESSMVGRGTYICENSSIRHTLVGKFCAIADNVRTGSGSHPSNTFVSIHPSFFSINKQSGFTFVDHNKFDEMPRVTGSEYVVEIGNDVWIGSNVRIMDGVKIGDGSIIGAGAVVTRDIEPYSINVGIPSRIIKYRFTSEQIDCLLKCCWWDKDFGWLERNAEYFENIDVFCEKFRKGIL